MTARSPSPDTARQPPTRSSSEDGASFTHVVRGDEPVATCVSADRGLGGTAAPPLTVLIADDHALVREGLRELLTDCPELRVVAQASTGREAVELTRELQPDVVVMDVSMPDMDGVEATRHIRRDVPATLVFGLSTEERSDRLHAIEKAGAQGYFSKNEDARRLLERLLTVQRARGNGQHDS